MSESAGFEGLLREALSPVEPPEHLSERLEHALQSITEMAAEELDAWELSAMKDPRNWARPAAAVVVGTGAGAGLVLLRARRRRPQSGGLSGASELAGRALRDFESQTKRLFSRR
ncbi:MAG: hypothetical protein ACYCU0_11495 [Solirubrobacteraceae bacterium]